MGTRNLTKVIDAQGVVKVAQYGQWDGYPSGQGVTALYHAHNAKLIERGLARVRWATQDELDNIYKLYPEMNLLGTDDSNNFGLHYPNLTRDTGADILGVVAYSVGEVLLVDQSAFEMDDLFCEGVYTIDFQRGKFSSNYNDLVVEFDLDNLPDQTEYLRAFSEHAEA